MFPLSQTAIAALTLSAPFLAGAATGVLRRRWGALLLAGSAVILYLVFLREMLASEDVYVRQLGAPLVGALFLAAWLLGELWGWIVRVVRRLMPVNLWAAVILCLVPAVGFSGWRIERQIVPETCLQGVTVAIREAEFRITPDDGARLAWQPGGSGEDWVFYSRDSSRKDETAQLCRLTGNGEVPVEPHEMTLGAVGVRLTSCRAGQPCITTDTSEFRIERVSKDDPFRPVPWFGDETRDDIRWSGTVSDGWHCFLPNGSFTWINCQRWQTPVAGVRVIASGDLPADEAPDRAIRELEDVISRWLERLVP